MLTKWLPKVWKKWMNTELAFSIDTKNSYFWLKLEILLIRSIFNRIFYHNSIVIKILKSMTEYLSFLFTWYISENLRELFLCHYFIFIIINRLKNMKVYSKKKIVQILTKMNSIDYLGIAYLGSRLFGNRLFGNKSFKFHFVSNMLWY